MRIGIAGPVSLSLLKPHLQGTDDLGDGYSFPFTAHLTLELLKNGHDVVVFALDPDTKEPRRFQGSNLTLCVGPLRRNGRARDYFAHERRLLRAGMQEEKPDVVHAHWTYEFALAALESGLPSLITIHDFAPKIFWQFRDPYRMVRLAMQTHVLAKATFLTVPSPYMAQLVGRWARKRATVIPNGVPDLAFPDRVASAPLPEGPIVLAAMNSGHSKRKNVKAFLAAADLLHSRGVNCQLHLAGADFEPGGAAFQSALAMNAAGCITYRGRISPSDVPAFMSSAHLFVHPSLEESFGMVILEAMACGVPVVAGYSSGAVPWLVGPNAGHLVDVRSPRAIADAVEALAFSPDRWAEAAKSARDRALTFHLRMVATAFETEYVRVLSQRCPG